MAVAVDVVGPGSGGSAVTGGHFDTGITNSWSHAATGTNRAVVVGVALGASTSDATLTTHTCTYDGVAMTSLGLKHSNNQVNGFVELFGLVNPPTGTKTVVSFVQGSAGGIVSSEAGSISFTGVDQTTPFGTAVTAAGDNSSGSTPPQATVVSATGDMVVDVVGYGSALSGATGTQRWLNNADTLSAAGNGAGSTYAGASSVTAKYNPTAHDWWGLVAVDVKQVSGGPTQVNGTGAATLGAIAASGTGQVTVLGSGTAPLDVFAASGTGVAVVLGAGTAPLGAITGLGGTFSVFGSGSATFSLNASGTGKVTSFGTGTAPLGTANASGVGSGATVVGGTGLASFDLNASGLGVATVLGSGSAQLGSMGNSLIQVLVFFPLFRKQTTMLAGSLRYSYPVSFTVWKDENGVWRAQETPAPTALAAATRLLAVSGRPQIVDDQTANELLAAGVGTIVPTSFPAAQQWI